VGAQPGKQVQWAFQFFSPTADRLALVSVTDGAAQVVREGVSLHPVPTFAAEEWRVDSGEALWTWWNRGGEELVAEHPQADLTMHLRVAEEGGSQPIWTVVGLVAGTEDATTVVVGATDGVVVEP
jgi:hypothetical protein